MTRPRDIADSINRINSSAADATAVTIDSSERVGIGTTSPAHLIDCRTTGETEQVVANFSSTGDGSDRQRLEIYVDPSTQTTELYGGAGGGSENNTNLAFSTRQGGSGRVEAMRIDSSGNVGIGTTSPTSNTILHLKDTDTQIELEGTNGSNSAFIDFDGTNLQLSTNRNMIDGAFSNTGKSNAAITMAGASGGSVIRFATASANNTVATERMRIDSSGNVTMSNQPMFHARRTSVSTIAAGNFIVYDGAYVNRGSHYSTSTGKFTAPVAGVYAFFWDSIASNTNGTYRLYIYKNGSIAGNGDMHLRYPTTDNKYGFNASRIVLFDLAANDYVQIYYSSGAANLYSGNDYLTFGGYLLG